VSTNESGLDSYISHYLDETIQIAKSIDQHAIKSLINALKDIREKNGRLFILGIGGSAGNASHAVNDFRKMAKIETYARPITFLNLRQELTMKVGSRFLLVG